jgi:hypothetical protein
MYVQKHILKIKRLNKTLELNDCNPLNPIWILNIFGVIFNEMEEFKFNKVERALGI